MSVPDTLTKLFQKIDENKAKYIENLKQAVAIQSVSAWAHKRDQVRRMMEWAVERCNKLGIKTELKELGNQKLPDGSEIPLPPALLGTFGSDPSKKTLLIYGHLDVQPALIEDGWDSEPFVLTERNGKLYGRGSSDDKGPVLGWFHAIEAYQQIGVDVPVNIKFIFEGMEESGSKGLDDLLYKEKDKFLSNLDYVCISDNYWLGTDTPCVTYGLRGVCYFHIEVECASKDLHSGVYGGTVHEAMTDLIHLLDTLVDKDGTIKICGINNEVAPLTDKEKELYGKINFSVDSYRSDVGTKLLLHKEKKDELLMRRWRYPALSLHGIEGAFSEPGQKTVIPRKVVGKFSIRIVPNQTPALIEKYVVAHVESKFKEFGSPNKMKSESNERMSFLQEGFMQNETLRDQLIGNLADLRAVNNTNLAELEESEDLKDIIKKFNLNFLEHAQQVYSYNQELSTELIVHNSELNENEELLKRNDDIFEEKIKQVERQAMALTQELDLLDKKEIECERKRALKNKAIMEENKQLRAVLKVLDMKIGDHELCIRKKSPLQEEDKCKKIIENLRKCVRSNENDIGDVSKLLEEIKQCKNMLEVDSEAKSSELDLQIKDSEMAIIKSRSTIAKLNKKFDEVHEQIRSLEEEAKQTENAHDENIKELQSVELTLKKLEESFGTDAMDREKSILEKEETYKQQMELKTKLQLDTSALKNDSDDKKEKMEEISGSLCENTPARDLKTELEEKEETQKALKGTHQQLKQKYDKDVLELEEQLKRGQEELRLSEEANEKLQQDTDKLDAELSKWKAELEKLRTQKKNQQKETGDLGRKIHKLNMKIAQKKKGISRKQDDTVTSQTGSPVKSTPRLRNWDSDSTIEGEDRRVSDMFKERMKKKKLMHNSQK